MDDLVCEQWAGQRRETILAQSVPAWTVQRETISVRRLSNLERVKERVCVEGGELRPWPVAVAHRDRCYYHC